MQPTPAQNWPIPRAGKRGFVARAVLGLVLFWLSALVTAVPLRAEPLHAREFLMAGDASRMRVVIQFGAEPELRWRLLKNPHRLVLDFPPTRFSFEEEDLEPRGMVSRILHGNFDADTSRIIVEADGPFAVERVEVLANETSPGYRLVADFVAASERQFEAALAEQIGITGATPRATPKSGRLAPDEGDGEEDRFVVVLDAGHGGIDSGAKGVTGTLEKTITLAFALELRQALEETGGYDVRLTRDRDIFLRLDERVRIAREHEADLFISIHADAVRQRWVRGATVYTVSERASDEEAAAKALRENLADQVAGVEVDTEVQPVTDILLDLIRRETQSFSIRFARSLVGELKADEMRMVTNPHRFAGFRVLKAPDVPSILLELGYLSNAADEKQLRDADWRAKAITSIIDAVDLFAARRISAGG